MSRHTDGTGILAVTLAFLLASPGCGRFTPPEEAPRGADLLSLAREAVRALRERDYQILYRLCSTQYRRARSYEEFLARNKAAETAYRLDQDLPASSRRVGEVEMFHLDARDPVSEEVVARADCWVNRRAKVKRLVPVPIDAEDAEKRAASLY